MESHFKIMESKMMTDLTGISWRKEWICMNWWIFNRIWKVKYNNYWNSKTRESMILINIHWNVSGKAEINCTLVDIKWNFIRKERSAIIQSFYNYMLSISTNTGSMWTFIRKQRNHLCSGGYSMKYHIRKQRIEWNHSKRRKKEEHMILDAVQFPIHNSNQIQIFRGELNNYIPN